MNTNRTTRMLRGSAVVLSLSAVVFVGAGTARAGTDPTYFSNSDGSMEVIYSGGGLTTYATVVDARNPEGSTEFCHYHSNGVMGTVAFPYDADTTVTGPHPSATRGAKPVRN